VIADRSPDVERFAIMLFRPFRVTEIVADVAFQKKDVRHRGIVVGELNRKPLLLRHLACPVQTLERPRAIAPLPVDVGQVVKRVDSLDGELIFQPRLLTRGTFRQRLFECRLGTVVLSERTEG
jgi:hypothetical protein